MEATPHAGGDAARWSQQGSHETIAEVVAAASRDGRVTAALVRVGVTAATAAATVAWTRQRWAQGRRHAFQQRTGLGVERLQTLENELTHPPPVASAIRVVGAMLALLHLHRCRERLHVLPC